MTIKPVRTYATPAYPTYQASKQDAHLLERLPRRWGQTLAPLLGTGILIQIVSTGCNSNDAQGKSVKITAVEPLGQKKKNVADAVRAIPATRVAPILEDALANDGRGGFGCIAVSAPVFLSEDEAIELIRAELEKAGVKLQNKVVVDGLNVPFLMSKVYQSEMENLDLNNLKRDKAEQIVMALMAGTDDVSNVSEITLGGHKFSIAKLKQKEKRKWQEGERIRLRNLERGEYTFDLGTDDKSVVVKFLQDDDWWNWREAHDSTRGNSVWRVDFSWLASQISDVFQKREDGEPVIIGLFFEPLTYPPLDNRLRVLEEEQETKKRAHEKLRQQVLHFVEYLKKEGVVK